MIPWVLDSAPFPPVETALREPRGPNGLLAASPDLSPDRLIAAYRQGIFPWYNEGEPVLWWSTDPRMVLRPADFRVHRSLRKTLRAFSRSATEVVVVDQDFDQVMRGCALRGNSRQETGTANPGTWITAAVRRAYGELHRRGLAISVEVRRRIDSGPGDAGADQPRGGELLGGLYGVSMGRAFFGESMFTRAPDRSKIALATLVRILIAEGVPMIDCQQQTAHLATLGARPVPRKAFCAELAGLVDAPPVPWQRWRGRALNELLAEA